MWRAGEDNGNMVRWDHVLSIFPNITKITFDTYRGGYGFSLQHFVKIISKLFSRKHSEHSLRSIEIKGLGKKGRKVAAGLNVSRTLRSKISLRVKGSILCVVFR